MKALTLHTKTKTLALKEVPDAQIQGPDEVKLKVLEVGICGTDREEISGARVDPPNGEEEIILGHEMLGEVVEVGKKVNAFKKGDLAVVTVRRGCGKCIPCQNERADICYTGDYLERGIKGRHGFQSQFVVDEAYHLVKVPQELRPFGVLCEPMSVVEKAIDEILKVQRGRLPDWSNVTELKTKKALVAGLGPIGLLASIALKLRGFQLFGLGVSPPDSPRAKIFQEIGGTYIDGRTTKPSAIPSQLGQIDLILEAAGVPALDFDLLHVLGNNGGYVLTGVPHSHIFEINGGEIIRNFVLKNQVALGSVNAGKAHWQKAIEDLSAAATQWPSALGALITSRTPHHDFLKTLQERPKDEIKAVITWS